MQCSIKQTLGCPPPQPPPPQGQIEIKPHYEKPCSRVACITVTMYHSSSGERPANLSFGILIVTPTEASCIVQSKQNWLSGRDLTLKVKLKLVLITWKVKYHTAQIRFRLANHAWKKVARDCHVTARLRGQAEGRAHKNAAVQVFLSTRSVPESWLAVFRRLRWGQALADTGSARTGLVCERKTKTSRKKLELLTRYTLCFCRLVSGPLQRVAQTLSKSEVKTTKKEDDKSFK